VIRSLEVLSALLLILFIASIGFSQSAVTGQVTVFYYKNGKAVIEPMPKITVNLSNLDSKKDYSVTTDTSGYYLIEVPEGQYSLMFLFPNLDGVALPIFLSKDTWLPINITFIVNNKFMIKKSAQP
jgi:hypothetical protein